MNKLLILILFYAASLSANTPMASSSFGYQKKIVINNRPLLKVNNKIISLMDVVKKMDLMIHENYPEATSNTMMRFQFYSQQWKYFLEDLWLAELMKADAEEKEIKVTEGDLREEIEGRFGPNVVATLDKLGLSYEEAREMIHSELIVQKMSWYKIYSPSYQAIAPKDVKGAYTTYLDQNPPKDEWEYQILTLQSDDQNVAHKLAKEACALLEKNLPEQKLTIEDAANKMSGDYPDLKITASKDYTGTSATLASEQKEVLSKLSVGDYSEPVKQYSRAAGGEVWRVFHLKKHKQSLPEEFQDIAQKLQDDLVQKVTQKNRLEYKKKLQEKFGLSDSDLKKEIPDDYIPFAIIDQTS